MPKLKQNMVYMGIDPGKSGGIAVVNGSRKSQSWKMPDTDSGMWDCIHEACSGKGVFACLEKVHAMPGQGVKSMFTFGENFGKMKMALTAAAVSYELVTPQAWQKKLGIPKRNTKSESKPQFKKRLKSVAEGLFPQGDVTMASADALLIAEYCRRENLKT